MAGDEGLQALTREILSAAEERAAEIRGAAGERAEAALRQAREAGATERERVVGEAGRQAARERARIESAAKLEARRRLLERREAVIGRVLAAVRAHLEGGLSGLERRQALEKLLVEAAAALGGGALTVQASPQDAPFLTPELLRQAASRLEAQGVAAEIALGPPAPILGGAIVTADGGRVVLDNSFDARLERMSWALRNEAWQALTERVAVHEGL